MRPEAEQGTQSVLSAAGRGSGAGAATASQGRGFLIRSTGTITLTLAGLPCPSVTSRRRPVKHGAPGRGSVAHFLRLLPLPQAQVGGVAESRPADRSHPPSNPKQICQRE